MACIHTWGDGYDGQHSHPSTYLPTFEVFLIDIDGVDLLHTASHNRTYEADR